MLRGAFPGSDVGSFACPCGVGRAGRRRCRPGRPTTRCRPLPDGLDVRPPPGYDGARVASGFGLNCPSKASIFSVPQPFGSSQKVR